MSLIKTMTKITAYLKPQCGWSNGVRAIFGKYDLKYTDKNVIDVAENYREMVEKSGQSLSPCVEIDGKMLADVSGEEVEEFLIKNKYVKKNNAPTTVQINKSCETHRH